MKRLLMIAAFAAALAAAARAELKLASLSTITTDIARNVGGDKVKLIPIVKPGIDPHEFQPSPSDIKEVEIADLVLITGKGIEGYLTKLEQTVGSKDKFVDVSSGIASLKLEEEDRIVEDPHWWHSIANMEKATRVVEKRLIEADPVNKATYERNTSTYLAALKDLETWAKVEVAQLPRNKRKLVTSHDAFQYFARDFGFKIYAIEGVSTDDEPSARKITDLIKTIKGEWVKAVFFESIENPKVVDRITKETGAKLGGKLYADGLGDNEAATYPDMVQYNITTIVEGLK
jgi:zinc/manganese transport system substrate-binding protein